MTCDNKSVYVGGKGVPMTMHHPTVKESRRQLSEWKQLTWHIREQKDAFVETKRQQLIS